MSEDRSARLFGMGIGGIAPIAVAAGLVALRDVLLNANVALILVMVVVGVAVVGGSGAGAVAAVASALSFDFFFTRPYLQLRIASSDDVETTVLLLAVGLIVGNVAARGRRAHQAAEATTGEIRRIHRVAELVARGEEPEDVILAAQAEVTQLLRLRSCRFEAPPFDNVLPRFERSGVIPMHVYHLRREGFELPEEGVELPVLGRGQLLGRFVLEPTPETGVSLEARVVAVAIADQVGAALATPNAREKGPRRG